MRLSIKIALISLAAVIALLVLNHREQAAPQASAPAAPTAADVLARVAAPDSELPAPIASAQRAPASTSLAVVPDETSDVDEQIQKLFEYAAYDDATSLQSILTELTNPNPEIRAAAREAAAQFGSRDAIPRLQEVAAATSDTQEKAALEETIEFLELPSWSEIRGQVSQAPQPQPARQKQGLLRR